MPFHPRATTPEVAADVVAIQQLASLYAYALDSRNYDLLDEIFTGDARLISSSGTTMSPAQYKALCATELPKLDATQHFTATSVVDVDGDRATARSYFQAQHVKRSLAPDEHFLMAGWVDDVAVRQNGRWYIAERVWTSVWSRGNPGVLGR